MQRTCTGTVILTVLFLALIALVQLVILTVLFLALTVLVHSAEQMPVMVKLLVLGGTSMRGETMCPRDKEPARY